MTGFGHLAVSGSWEMMFCLVELRGFEPQTSCMPFLAESSGGVEMGRAPAGQTGCSVCQHPAAAETVFMRSHLVSHWSFGSPRKPEGSFQNRISAFISKEIGEAATPPPAPPPHRRLMSAITRPVPVRKRPAWNYLVLALKVAMASTVVLS
jgi:hypothetical protein